MFSSFNPFVQLLPKQQTAVNSLKCSTVEPRFNEPLYNEVLGITNDILQPGESYSKMYGTQPRYNEILVITSTTQNPKRKMYLDITNKCQHATEKMNAKQTKKDEAS